jgi:hypothetical protein
VLQVTYYTKRLKDAMRQRPLLVGTWASIGYVIDLRIKGFSKR